MLNIVFFGFDWGHSKYVGWIYQRPKLCRTKLEPHFKAMSRTLPRAGYCK